jgi:Cof subfamily protein (haloacid dehalogenase superfamily)
MMSTVKIVFFDVDGTLLHDKQIPDSAKKGIELLKQHDILPVIATGRSEYEMRPIRESLGIDWALTCNGSHIGHRGKTVIGTPFPQKWIVEWMELAREHDHTFLLYGAENFYSNRPDCPYFLQARREIGFMDPQTFEHPADLPPIYQCIFFGDETAEKHYTAGKADDLYLHRWRPWALDLNPGGINKKIGIQRLLEHLGLSPDQAAAIGDGRNDIEMIEYVGLGIAMGNACPELLQVADRVTRHAGEDGILHAVEQYILG